MQPCLCPSNNHQNCNLRTNKNVNVVPDNSMNLCDVFMVIIFLFNCFYCTRTKFHTLHLMLTNAIGEGGRCMKNACASLLQFTGWAGVELHRVACHTD